MAAPYNPPKKNEDCIFYISLEDYTNPGNFKANPTLAAGDFKVTTDGSGPTDLGTLPAVEPASSVFVKVTLASGEMNGDKIGISCIDQTSPKEWADLVISIPTTQ